MLWGQSRTCLSPEEMNVRIWCLTMPCCLDFQCVTESDIPNEESLSNTDILRTDIAEDTTGLQLNASAIFC